MPSHYLLQQLDRLDGSPSKFHNQLNNILHGEEFKQSLLNLQGDDLTWLVDYLDGAIDGLDPSAPAFSKCLHELRSICGARTILPTSYILSGTLRGVGSLPFTLGGSGDVYEGILDGTRVSIKRVRMHSKGNPGAATKILYQEAVVWKHLVHQNIVPLLGITFTPLQLISEWMTGGGLTEHVKKNPNADRVVLLSDVAGGLCHLHSCNVIHGELKGSNILVDATGRARITDFRLATVTTGMDSELGTTYPHDHTSRWTAPEVLNGRAGSKEADVFSFAMVMIEVFTSTVPFSDCTSGAAVMTIIRGGRPQRPTDPSFTESLWTLMQRCWDHDPQLRPEFSAVLKVLLTLDPPAWKQLISDPLSTDERVSLLTSILTDRNELEVARRLSGTKAQAFIDVMDEVLDSLPQQTRRKCLRSLYRICGHQALLPTSLAIPLCYDPTKTPQRYGGFADVWRGQHNGREVAVKVLRVCQISDFERIRKRFCKEVVTWKALHHPNVLPLLGVTMTESRFVMVSEWMAKGNINEFMKVDINADRFELLRDITRGLIYMHDQGIVHGDLKGANILIKHDGHACLSDFSLVTVISDPQTFLSSCMEGGTTPWMSPELLDPESFGLKKSYLTKESDCYALGMVVYEVLSGRAPFYPSRAPVVKVLQGERPERPQEPWFTDDIWRTLQFCWNHWPGDRISAKTVLLDLEGNSSPSGPSPNWDGAVKTDTDDESDATSSDSGPTIACIRRGRGRLHGGNLQASPPQGSSKEGWIDRLARNAREKFKATT